MNDPFARDRRKVELVPHEPEWAARAAAESERLAQAIGDTLIRIEHVGSTSIHGIVAKPIIDLMPIVRSHSELDARRPQVEALGYVWRGEFGIPGRRYCIMEQEGRRLFHVHCHQEGHPGIAHTVDFRDYLRASRGGANLRNAEACGGCGASGRLSGLHQRQIRLDKGVRRTGDRMGQDAPDRRRHIQGLFMRHPAFGLTR